MATIYFSNTADSGDGSFRKALELATADDIIAPDPSVFHPGELITITLSTFASVTKSATLVAGNFRPRIVSQSGITLYARTGGQFLHVDGYEFVGRVLAYFPESRFTRCLFAGNAETAHLVQGYAGASISLTDCLVVGSKRSGVYQSGARSSLTLTRTTVAGCVRPISVGSTTTFTSIDSIVDPVCSEAGFIEPPPDDLSEFTGALPWEEWNLGLKTDSIYATGATTAEGERDLNGVERGRTVNGATVYAIGAYEVVEADYYYVGPGGSFNTAANWRTSQGAVPTSIIAGRFFVSENIEWTDGPPLGSTLIVADRRTETFNMDVSITSVDACENVCIALNSAHVGIAGFTNNVPAISGSGFLAVPANIVISIPSSVVRTVYGAGISALTSSDATMSWSSVDSTKSVLLEKQNGSTWTTISTSATSPTTVANTGTYRIWDGSTFLTISLSFPLVVTNTNDSGAGSLRAAINSATATDTIIFDPSLAGETIRLRSGLSSAGGVTIVGLTDVDGKPAITIDGSPDIEILCAEGPVNISDINFENGDMAFWTVLNWDGSSFSNCTFSGFILSPVQFVNNADAVQTVTFSNCIFEGNPSASLFLASATCAINLVLEGGNVFSEGFDTEHAVPLTITNSGYNGIGSNTLPPGGFETVTGSGVIALPSSSEFTVQNTVTRSEFGAGLDAITANKLTISWTADDATKSVLLEQQNGSSWDVVDAAASSPTTVFEAGTYRLWDGINFLETVVSGISDHAWVVYANAIAVDSTPAIVVTTGYLMMSSYYNRGETPILFARLEDSETGDPLDDDLVESASYTCFRRTYYWGVESLTPVDGHENVAVPTSAFLSSLVTTDDRWTTDSTGYNFKYEPDATQTPLFPVAGSYVVVVTVNLTSGNPVPIVYEVSVQ